eukprot:4310507-Ditylum_brightwellii.AAC.1
MALNMLKIGLIQTMQDEIHIGIQYEDNIHTFGIVGDSKMIGRAMHRMDRYAKGNDRSCIGCNIKQLKCKLRVSSGLMVNWNAESQRIKVSSSVALTEDTKAQLYAEIQDMVSNGVVPF